MSRNTDNSPNLNRQVAWIVNTGERRRYERSIYIAYSWQGSGFVAPKISSITFFNDDLNKQVTLTPSGGYTYWERVASGDPDSIPYYDATDGMIPVGQAEYLADYGNSDRNYITSYGWGTSTFSVDLLGMAADVIVANTGTTPNFSLVYRPPQWAEWKFNSHGFKWNLTSGYTARRCILYWQTQVDPVVEVNDVRSLPENAIISFDWELDWAVGTGPGGQNAATNWAQIIALVKSERPDLRTFGFSRYPHSIDFDRDTSFGRNVVHFWRDNCNNPAFATSIWEYTELEIVRKNYSETYAFGGDALCVGGVRQNPAWWTTFYNQIRSNHQAMSSRNGDNPIYTCTSGTRGYLDLYYLDCDATQAILKGHPTCPDVTLNAGQSNFGGSILSLTPQCPQAYAGGQFWGYLMSDFKDACQNIYQSGGWLDYIDLVSYLSAWQDQIQGSPWCPERREYYRQQHRLIARQMAQIANRYGIKLGAWISDKVAPLHGKPYDPARFEVLAVPLPTSTSCTVSGDATTLIGKTVTLTDDVGVTLTSFTITNAVFDQTNTVLTYNPALIAAAGNIVEGTSWDAFEMWLEDLAPYVELYAMWDPPHNTSAYSYSGTDLEADMIPYIANNRSRPLLGYERLKYG